MPRRWRSPAIRPRNGSPGGVTPLAQAILLLVLVNGSPVVLARLLGTRAHRLPLDGGRRLADGRPLFGSHKTVPGLAAALVTGALAAPLLGISWTWGLGAATAAMGGDLLSSFIKRRLGLGSGAMALGLDQLPESLFGLLVLSRPLALGAAEIAAGALAFLVLELVLSRIGYWLGLRDRPH